jgi:hypothetical protein
MVMENTARVNATPDPGRRRLLEGYRRRDGQWFAAKQRIDFRSPRHCIPITEGH